MSIAENNSSILIDNHGRRMDYLRLAVTDRCNLRCQYCMPEQGVKHVPHDNILRWEEMLRLCRILVDHGLRKIRITGGEPFVRKDLVPFLAELAKLEPRPQIGITTNGVLLDRYLDQLEEADIKHLNISLDSLSPQIYKKITRRNNFKETWNSLLKAVNRGFNVKTNTVLQPGLNDDEIEDFVKLTKSLPITARFIEPMPFSGSPDHEFQEFSGYKIKERLEKAFDIKPLNKNDSRVATLYKVKGYAGRVGIIFAFSRTFCDSCSRMRISAQGQMRTCLYGQNVLDLRELLRCGSSDKTIINAINNVLQKRFKNGFEAEKHRTKSLFESMSAIGG
ncbi:GTP 3',8-cyclase MoaA [Aliifodinibius sp. S!AR15-10]|uniref:GTP 3',8-cyclase MoaA n=1 Tax=Aliifodinibius sp. S!AR15-10 TaxID=2950437 RepID=UPI0028566F31|nr:GTP 3',8-cyclase MoaA [Aliifodinibius sp. S!AR15-10]MDR8390741.1 GTP 3',8-cyclase MoaA [Aliifodinibius sp. S!AR15-10]